MGADNMKRKFIPTIDELEKYAQDMPELEPSAIVAMLEIMQAGEAIQQNVNAPLEQEFHLSEGKLRVMIILYQQEVMAPSALAVKAGVTRATISAMLRRMQRDGLVMLRTSPEDGRARIISLTAEGRKFMDRILPVHYKRISTIMCRLTRSEREALIVLLRKVAAA
jgi:DNA-binding MarR family transcriptional regulator